MYWDDNNGTISLGMHGGQVVQQIGLEQYYYVKNQSGATIENGRVVRAAGTLGASGRILGEYMIADGTIPAKYTLGVATEDILNGDDGYVTEFGLVRGIDTTGSVYGETWSDGDVLWVSPTIAGGLTNVEPVSPDLHIEIAIVIYANANGSIFVRPNRYPHLYDLQEVNYSAGTENNLDILQWNSGNLTWDKTNSPTFSGLTATTISATTYQNLPTTVSALTATDGISGSSTTGNITIVNTDKGSSQNIFKNIQIDGVTQFSANSNSSNLNFSGINISITSAATNTLIFSASSVVQGITGITAGTGISASTTNNVTTITNTSPDQTVVITGGTNIQIVSNYPNFGVNYTGDTSLTFNQVQRIAFLRI